MKEKLHSQKYLLLFILLFFIGFLATFSYGKYWDEPTEQDILYMNIKEYVIQLFPEDSTLYQTYSNNPLPPISLNQNRDHGVAPYYLIHPLLQANLSEQNRMFVWHVYTYLLFFTGVISLYYIMLQISNKKGISITTVLMYFFSPRIFADGHYNNKDMVELSLLLCLIALFFSLLKEVKWWKIVLASLIFGLLVNTKIIGICLAGVLVIMYIILAIIKKETPRNISNVLVGGGILSLLFFFLLTPAMWNSPLEYFLYNLESSTAFYRWNGYVRFLGEDYLNGSLPKMYLIVMFITTTPLYILICSGIGHLCLLGKLITEKTKFFGNPKNIVMCAMFISWFAPVAYAVLSRMPLYNGWRHLFFIYGPFIIIAGYGIEQSFMWLLKLKNHYLYHICATLLGLCMAWTIIGVAVNHPYQYAYYNILGKNNADQLFEMDYWNVSIKDALNTIENLTDQSVTVSSIDYYSMDGIKKSLPITKHPQKINVLKNYEEDWQSADYLIVNITYSLIHAPDTYEFVQKTYPLVHSINSYGNSMIEIYKVN